MSELHRFTRQLVESLSSHDSAALGAPVPLEDITARVLPYRACRRLFGILNVEDYELLLMRLVAGEAGLAAGSPLAAVDRCRAELDTGHPDPGVLNELEGVTLRLNLGAIALGDVVSEDAAGTIVRSYTLYEPETEPEVDTTHASEPPPDEAAETVDEEPGIAPEAVEATPELDADETVEFDSVETPAAPIEDAPRAPEPAIVDLPPAAEADPFQALFDAAGDGPEPEVEPEPRLPLIAEPPEPVEPPTPTPQAEPAPPRPLAPPPPAAHGEPPPRCPHCASRLPSGRPVRFCPHCGSNVVPLQCVSCGAGLEPAWRHCVLCGAPAVHDSRFA